MNKKNIRTRLLAAVMAALLWTQLPVLPALAAQTSVDQAQEVTVPTAPEPTSATTPQTTVATVPETTAPTTPQTTAVTVPETTAATVPETTAATVPETTAAAVPEPTLPAVQETTAETVPESIVESQSASEDGLSGTSLLLEGPVTQWQPTSWADILPTDQVLLTARWAEGTLALGWNGEGLYPAAASVDGGVLSAPAELPGWSVDADELGYILRPTGSSGWLYVTAEGGLRVGTGGGPYWRFENGGLTHISTKGVLLLDDARGWTAEPGAVCALEFWRLPRTSTVTAEPSSGALTPGQHITLTCPTEGASIYYALSTDGVQFTDPVLYTGPIVPEQTDGLRLRCWATAPGLSQSPETLCVYSDDAGGSELYFGLLHAHTDISDGLGSVQEAFAHAAQVEGLDFFAVTDHSNSFEDDVLGSISQDGAAVSRDWAAGKAAAASVTGPDFVGICGYEMTWQDSRNLGHINTFNTPGWQSRNQDGFYTLESYYQALTTVPGAVGMFNHPGRAYGNFENFSHHKASYDQVMALLEVGGEGGFRAYDAYTQALDAGWHVAPTISQNNHNGAWGDESDVRTAILAEELTEQALYQAMLQRRVYATEDRDLSIIYHLNEALMGATIPAGEEAVLQIDLSDPTDAGQGTVEVMVDGGTVAASQTVDMAGASITVTLPGTYHYYYLRVTQADGDIAVTAPVWLEQFEDVGIASFVSTSQIPVQNKPVDLELTLFNEEDRALTVEELTFSIDGQTIHRADAPGEVPSGGTFAYAFSHTCSDLGTVRIQAQAVLDIAGIQRTCTMELTLNFQAEQLISGMLVDGGHGNSGITALNNLTALATGANTQVTVFTGAVPEGGELLLIQAPEGAFEESFLASVVRFLEGGGSLIVCGRSDSLAPDCADALNELLEAAGSTMRLHDDTARDPDANNGGQDVLQTGRWNPDAPLLEGLENGQVYYHREGCTVSPGQGLWLARGYADDLSFDGDADGRKGSGNVLIACEQTAWGGVIVAAGCPFLTDEQMVLSGSAWLLPSMNQSILEALLESNAHDQVESLPLTPIAEVRTGTHGQLYRVQGYVTAGTANPYNQFRDTIYLQDDSGGIAVVPFEVSGISVGTPLEVTGVLDILDGNLVLRHTRYQVLDLTPYRHVPRTMACATATDYASHGGELVQVQGEVVSVISDGSAVRRFVVKDLLGNLATVVIEENIGAGSTGKNTLASQVQKGRTVRAMGILHLDESGQPVLRVRNCEEVVYIIPLPDPSNPKTGDGLLRWLTKWAVVFLGS